MKDLNRWEGIGRLAQDPRLRYTPQGKAVVNFTVATNRQWRTEDGERQEQSEFTPCVAWDKLAELVTQYLLKGARVWVEGSLHTRKWEDRDGQTRSTTECVVSNLIMLGSRPSDRHASIEHEEEGGSFEEADELPPTPAPRRTHATTPAETPAQQPTSQPAQPRRSVPAQRRNGR